MSSRARPICLPSSRARRMPLFYALDDQTSFEFANGDDDDHGATQRAGSVNVFSKTDQSDVQVIEFVQNF